MSSLFPDEAARLRRDELLEEAAAVRLAKQARNAQRPSHRFFGWIGALWAERVGHRSRSGTVKGACCA